MIMQRYDYFELKEKKRENNNNKNANCVKWAVHTHEIFQSYSWICVESDKTRNMSHMHMRYVGAGMIFYYHLLDALTISIEDLKKLSLYNVFIWSRQKKQYPLKKKRQ